MGIYICQASSCDWTEKAPSLLPSTDCKSVMFAPFTLTLKKIIITLLIKCKFLTAVGNLIVTELLNAFMTTTNRLDMMVV